MAEHAHSLGQLGGSPPLVHADTLKLPQRLLLWRELDVGEGFGLGLALDLLDVVGAAVEAEHGDVGGGEGNRVDGLVFGVELGSLVLLPDQVAGAGPVLGSLAGAAEVEHQSLYYL